MDRDAAALSGLALRLGRWVETIQRATGARVAIERADSGLAWMAEWPAKGGGVTTLSQALTRDVLFAPGTSVVTRRACDLARDFIRAILEARGVLVPLGGAEPP